MGLEEEIDAKARVFSKKNNNKEVKETLGQIEYRGNHKISSPNTVFWVSVPAILEHMSILVNVLCPLYVLLLSVAEHQINPTLFFSLTYLPYLF